MIGEMKQFRDEKSHKSRVSRVRLLRQARDVVLSFSCGFSREIADERGDTFPYSIQEEGLRYEKCVRRNWVSSRK